MNDYEEKLDGVEENHHHHNNHHNDHHHHHHHDHYHLVVSNEDAEDVAGLASTTHFSRSSIRYSLRKDTDDDVRLITRRLYHVFKH